MKCSNCASEVPSGEVRCSSCGAAVSLLVAGELVPRLQQTRAVELISIGPSGLLWLADKGRSQEKLLIAEYEPKGGGKARLREFSAWCQRLKTLPGDVLPPLEHPFAYEERLFLVFDATGWQSAKSAIDLGQTNTSGADFLQRLLRSIDVFTRTLGTPAHGWIRAETVAISDGKVLLGPPSFDPGAGVAPQSDLAQSAVVTSQWMGVPIRLEDADAERSGRLRSIDDWPLAATLEWMLTGTRRFPLSAAAAAGFLDEGRHLQNGTSERELAGTLETLKQLYDRSGSAIVKTRIAQTEAGLDKVRKANRPAPRPPTPEPKAPPPPPPPTERKVDQPPAPAPVRPVEPEPEPEPELEQPSQLESPRTLKPEPRPTPTGGWLWKAALAAAAAFGLYYYVYSYISQAPVREFNSYFDRQVLVNPQGPSAYSVYQKTLREKGPDSDVVRTMNSKALPVLQRVSKEGFDSWFRDSELSRPRGGEVNAVALTSWPEMVQVQEWLSTVDTSPQSAAQLSYARGMAALIRREWDEAARQFEEALRQQPNWALALNGLGRTYFGRKQYDLTAQYYRKAIDADPSWYFPHANLATLYRDVLKDFGASEREYREAIRLDPNRASFHYNLGQLYFIQGKKLYGLACPEFRTALTQTGRSLTPDEVATATRRRDLVCKGQ